MRVITGFLAALVVAFAASSAPAAAQGVPITSLPAATPLPGSLLPAVVNGVTSKVTVQQLLSTTGAVLTNLPLNQFAPGTLVNGQCVYATSTTAISSASCASLLSGSYVSLSPGSQQSGFLNLSGASTMGSLTVSNLTVGVMGATFSPFNYGAKCDEVGAVGFGGTGTDDTAAFRATIAAWYAAGASGTILIPAINPAGGKSQCYITGSLALPNSGTFKPTQPALRITSDGGAIFNGFWDDVDCRSTKVAGPCLDLRYDGTDHANLAKINTFGAGVLEIDHVTLEDLGTSNLPFVATTSTTLFAHHNGCIGNPGHTGVTSNQDCFVLGQNGYPATNASITTGTNLLTVGGGDPPFTSAMVGYSVSVAGAGAAGAILTNVTIASVVSSTQVHLSGNAGTTVTGATANYWASGTGDIHDAFQGYGTALHDNFFSRIRRATTYNQYANSVLEYNETVSLRSGSSDTLSCPFYFSGVPGYGGSWGVNLRDSTVEISNYKYAACLTQDDGFATFSNVQAWDPNGGPYIAMLYSGASARQSTIIAGYSNISGPIAAGPTASSHTVIASPFVTGAYAAQSSFPGGFVGNLITSSAVAAVVGGSVAASVSPGDGNFGRSAGTGFVILGTGTAAQTAQLVAISNKLYFVPTSNSGTAVTIDAAGNVATPAGVCPGNLTTFGSPCTYSGIGAPTFVAPNGSEYLQFDSSQHYYNTSGASTSGSTWTAALGSSLPTLTFGTHLSAGTLSSYNGLTAGSIVSDATAANTASTIMLRDGSGQVAATTFTGALNGNAASATIAAGATVANTATAAANVIGTDDTTTNATYYPLFEVATGTAAVKTSSSKLTYNPSTGAFGATTFLGALTGNADTATKLATPRAINGVNFDGSAPITVKATATNALTFGTHLVTGAASYDGSATATLTSDCTSASTASTMVCRDASQNFSAGTITAALTGNASTATSATSATNATNTAITDDTTTNATMYPTWVTANTGNLPQKTTSTKLTFNPSTGVLATTTFSGSGASLTAIPNSATTAASANTASAIVTRDSSGNFIAGTITAALTGNASTATTATNATNTAITDDTATNADTFITFVTTASGNQAQRTSSTKLFYHPSNGRVGFGASPSFALDVLAPGSNDGLRVNSTQNTWLRVDSTSANAASRNWLISTNQNSFGDWSLRTSTAINGDPAAAGVNRLSFDPSGNATLAATLVGSSNGSTLGYHPPVYLAAGTITASTMHCVVDKVTAGGVSTTVTLSGAAAFASANYFLGIEDDTAFAAVTVTAQAAGSFTFTSVNTRVYSFTACGA